VRRAEENADEMIGQDSFLDVVTNIVGILILLVMVIGMRSSKAAATAVGLLPAAEVSSPADEEALQEAVRLARNEEGVVKDLVRRAYDNHSESLLREQERQWLVEAVAEAERDIDVRRGNLSKSDQRDFDLRRELSDAQLKLDALTREHVALLAAEPDIEQIKCEPTPIARAVNGKEIHVQLANDHIAILPSDELIEQMYADFSENSWRLKHEDEMVRTIGPLNGFRLQYRFEVKDVVAQNRSGMTVSGKKPEFIGLYFLPISVPLGEPAAEALQPGSDFQQRIGRVDATRTAVTIWTYPGNYDRLREMRRVLREFGFQTAIRPLPKGCPIGFSPGGSRSVTE
jgi:hypothetical protein